MLVKVYTRVVGDGQGTMRVERTSAVAHRLPEACGLLDTFGIDGVTPKPVNG